MENNITIFKSLKYIEDNINEPIDVADVSNKAGYSVFHFSRMFKKQMGMSIMEYVKQRKLIKASDDILQGMKIIDVTVKYGYESHSGFTRAFKKEFDISPSLLRLFKYQTDYFEGGNSMSHAFMKNTDVHASKEELYNILLNTIKENDLNCNLKEIKKGYEFACKAYNGQLRYSDDEYVTHPINVAILLAEMEANEDTILAGMLCDVLNKTNVTVEDLMNGFPNKVVEILKKVKGFTISSDEISEEVIMVKSAERLHNMRTIDFMDSDKWKQKAKETLEVFSSLINNKNHEKMKAELNDLSMKYIIDTK